MVGLGYTEAGLSAEAVTLARTMVSDWPRVRIATAAGAAEAKAGRRAEADAAYDLAAQAADEGRPSARPFLYAHIAESEASAGLVDRVTVSLDRMDKATALGEGPYRSGALAKATTTRIRLSGGDAVAAAAAITDADARDAVMNSLVEEHIKTGRLDAARTAHSPSPPPMDRGYPLSLVAAAQAKAGKSATRSRRSTSCSHPLPPRRRPRRHRSGPGAMKCKSALTLSRDLRTPIRRPVLANRTIPGLLANPALLCRRRSPGRGMCRRIYRLKREVEEENTTRVSSPEIKPWTDHLNLVAQPQRTSTDKIVRAYAIALDVLGVVVVDDDRFTPPIEKALSAIDFRRKQQPDAGGGYDKAQSPRRGIVALATVSTLSTRGRRTARSSMNVLAMRWSR